MKQAASKCTNRWGRPDDNPQFQVRNYYCLLVVSNYEPRYQVTTYVQFNHHILAELQESLLEQRVLAIRHQAGIS